jgi:hypothetical protein
MKTYLYPQNLRATANLWLWSLRDFAILMVSSLLAVLLLVNTGFFAPVALVPMYGFMTIRLEDVTVMDFLRYAIKYFISTQQHFEWRQLGSASAPRSKLPRPKEGEISA